MKEKTNRLYEFNGFQLEVDEGLLKKGPDHVPLTPKAFDTLIVLLKNRGKVVEKEILLNEVWADTFVEESTLAQNIFTLRKVLGTQENGQQIIETVPRRGYRFIANVSEIISTEEAIFVERNLRTKVIAERSIHESDGSDVEAHEVSIERFEPRKHRSAALQFFSKNKVRLAAAVFLLVAVLLVSVLSVNYFQTQKAATMPPSSVRSIAVLPFQPIDEQSREAKLGLGMADSIIIRLSKLQKIPVRPTSSVFGYIEQPVLNSVTAGRDLGVDAILEGTVQRDAERVRVSVQLIGIADGKPIWAETFDEKFTSIFTLQDSIASSVARSLALKLTPEQWKLLEQRATNNPEAYEAYQLGVYFWNTRTKENLSKAVGYFERSIEADPNYARAYAMLADTYGMTGYYGFGDRDDMYQKARTNAAHALALDDSVAEAHIAMASVQASTGNVEAAQRSIERAIELAPYNSTARIRYAWILFRSKKQVQAVEEMRLAREYDPLSPVSNGALCNILMYRENFVDAVRSCEKSYDLSPDVMDSRLRLAYAYFFSERTDEAIKLAEADVKAKDRKFTSLGALAFFSAKTGRRSEAEAIVRKLIPEAGKDAELFIDLALITYALGRKDESFKYFESAYKKKMVSVMSFNNDPMWKDVREDPRFTGLMEEK